MGNKKNLFIIIIAITISSCGGRPAKPVSETSPLDQYLTCSHIVGELQVNKDRVNELTDEKSSKGGANVGMVILLGPAGIPFIDATGSEKEEIEAISQRNAVLIGLAENKSCDVQSVMQ